MLYLICYKPVTITYYSDHYEPPPPNPLLLCEEKPIFTMLSDGNSLDFVILLKQMKLQADET